MFSESAQILKLCRLNRLIINKWIAVKENKIPYKKIQLVSL